MRLILASASPRRRALLDRLGVTYAIAGAALDEAVAPGESPHDYVRRLAHAKARTVRLKQPEAEHAIVIGADTSVILDGRILGKPGDAPEARAMLAALRGRVHQVMTGVAVEGPGTASRSAVCTTDVRMRAYSADKVERYIATGNPFDKAGGYAIQHTGFAPVEGIEGCYLNVVGLPLCRLGALLSAAGVPLGDQAGAFRAPEGGVCRWCQAREARGEAPV